MPQNYSSNGYSVSSGNKALYHTANALKSYLSVVPVSTVLATGTISGATLGTSGEQYVSLSLSGLTVNSVAWPRNTTIWVGSAAGLHDIGIYRLRNAYSPGSNSFVIGEAGLGDGGLLAQTIRTSDLAGGQYISVMGDFSPWSINPRIVPADTPPFYKDYDSAWNYETTFPAPLLFAGSHMSIFSSGYGASASYTVSPVAAQLSTTSIQPYTLTVTAPGAWSLTSGSTTQTSSLTTGTVAFSPITWNIPPGFWVLQLSVNCTRYDTFDGYVLGPAGVTAAQTRYVCVWVYDGLPGDAGATFTPVSIQEVATDQLTVDGSTMTVKLANQDAVYLRDGSMVNVFDVPYFTGGTPSQIITQRPGWVMNVANSVEPGLSYANVTIGGTGVYAKTMNANSQRVDAINVTLAPYAVPASWQETTTFSLPGYYMAAYLLRHQTNLLELVDFLYSFVSDSTPTVTYIVPKGNVWAQIQNVAERTLHMITCDSMGSIWFFQNPQIYLNPVYRIISAVATIDETDVTNVNYTRNMRPPTGHVIAEGFTGAVYDATVPQAKGLPIPVKARMPGGSGGQGVTEETLTNLIVYDQATLNAWAGNYYAWKNNPLPQIDIELGGNYWAFEPGHFFNPVSLSIPAQYTPDNKSFSIRVFPNSANRTRNSDGSASVKLTAEAETGDVAGVTETIPPPINPIPPIIVPPPPPPPDPCAGSTWPKNFNATIGVYTASPPANAPNPQSIQGVLRTDSYALGNGGGLYVAQATINIPATTITHIVFSCAFVWNNTFGYGFAGSHYGEVYAQAYDALGNLLTTFTGGGGVDGSPDAPTLDWANASHAELNATLTSTSGGGTTKMVITAYGGYGHILSSGDVPTWSVPYLTAVSVCP